MSSLTQGSRTMMHGSQWLLAGRGFINLTKCDLQGLNFQVPRCVDFHPSSKLTWVIAVSRVYEDLTPRVGQFTTYHVCHSWTAPLQALPGRAILALPRPLGCCPARSWWQHVLGSVCWLAARRAHWNLLLPTRRCQLETIADE